MYDRISSNASASESMKRGSSAHSSHCSSSELKYLDAASSVYLEETNVGRQAPTSRTTRPCGRAATLPVAGSSLARARLLIYVLTDRKSVMQAA